MDKSIIVGVGNNREIGLANKLLWHLPADLKMFKKVTMGCPIIMGRKTFESIGRALPGRVNIVITRNKEWSSEPCLRAHSLEEAYKLAEQSDASEAFVIGGGEIYRQALESCDKLYLSQIDFDGEADTFFPDYSGFDWESTHREEFSAEDGRPKWSFSILKKK